MTDPRFLGASTSFLACFKILFIIFILFFPIFPEDSDFPSPTASDALDSQVADFCDLVLKSSLSAIFNAIFTISWLWRSFSWSTCSFGIFFCRFFSISRRLLVSPGPVNAMLVPFLLIRAVRPERWM